MLLVVAGCGGGGDGNGETATPTTLVATEPATPSSAGSPIVVDTDLAADDIVALSYLTSHPGVELTAVTVSGTGEVRCPRGARIARSLLNTMGEPDVPVACGSSSPVSGDREFPAPWRMGADAAYGLLLTSEGPPSDSPTAVELLIDSIGSSPEPVTVLTLGPLTNLAEALAAEPDLAANVARVVVMGGAIDVPGNVQPDGASEPLAAEWNLYVDPTAAAAVVESGTPVTLVALDATNHVPVTEDLIERLTANDTTDATARVLHLFGDVLLPPYLWDPLAAIAAAEPGLVPTRAAEIAVVTDGDDAGRTIAEPGAARIDVVDAPDTDVVIDHLLGTLAGVPEGGQLATPTTLPVLGAVTVDFDGTTCSYTGPPTLPAGAYDVSTGARATDYVAAVAHLVTGATVDDVLAWVAEHPDEDPPMVDDIGFVGGWAEASPAQIVFRAGTVVIACGTEDGAVHVAGTVDVSG